MRGDRKSGINDMGGNYYQANSHPPAYKGFTCHRGWKSKAIDEFINVTAFYHLPTLRGFCESGKTLGP